MRKFIAVLVLFLLASPAWSADEWLVTRPALTGDQWTAWPAASQANNKSLDRLLANYREGMTLSYSSATTVAVSAGEVVCSNSDGSVRKMRQNTSATNVTFSDIDTGSEASSTTYYIYANCDADATTATFKISASSTAPTGVTYYKRLGSFYNDSSSNIQYVYNDNNSSVLGSWSLKSDGVNYLALTDGFVTAFGNDIAGYQVIACYTDSSSTPTTKRVHAGETTTGNWTGLTCPVKKGDYWRVDFSSFSYKTVYWIPQGN